MRTSRREFCAMLAGASILAPTFDLHAKEQRSLKALAAKKGILFGSAVGAGTSGSLTGSFSDPEYLKILKDECAIIVPENELKSYVISPTSDKFDLEPGDRIAAFVRNNRMKLRGHTLLWNHPEYMPKWLAELDSATAAREYLLRYIQRVCSHYGDRIYSWDVVNETLDPKTGELRDTSFTRLLGFDALRISYETAKEYAPRAQLVYNDYMSWGADHEKHRAGVLKLLEQFRSSKVPVDALGIQSHIGNVPMDETQRKEWKAFLDAVTAMDYRLLITEFDVGDKDLPTDFATRDARVAAAAKDYLDFMLAYREVDQVLCWGMVDKYSWLQGFKPRADGTAKRSTPYDDAYKAKPMREAMAAAFEAAPKRRALLRS
ncbi:MAG: endo-1,4-beta-xylanase [Steroidobacteraceae bacterium]